MNDLDRIKESLAGGHGDDQRAIAEKGLELVARLLRKNAAYGSSAFNPVRVFARGVSPLDGIHVRMDDKISRLARGHAIDDESFADTIWDLAGYCVLERVARDRVGS